MIDLAEYTPAIRKFIKQRKMCAVCVFAYNNGQAPAKITYSFDPKERLDKLQDGNPYITIEYLIWTPGLMVAQSGVQSTRQTFEDRKLCANWYKIAPGFLADVAGEVMHKLFPGAKIVSHVGLMQLLSRSKANESMPLASRLY